MPHRERPPLRPLGRAGRARRIRRIVLWTVAGVVLFTAGLGSWLYHRLDASLDSVDIEAELGTARPEPEPGKASTLLVVGTDSRAAPGPADAENDGRPEPDTEPRPEPEQDAFSTMVLRLPEDGTPPTAVNLPPALRVAAPPCAGGGADSGGDAEPRTAPLAALHGEGGPSCLVRAVEELSGIRMDHYIEVDFAGIGELAAALDVPASPPDGGGGGPAAELEPQQRELLRLLGEVQRQGVLSSPAKLYRVADAAAGALTTDAELASLTGLLAFVRELGTGGTERMNTLALPADPAQGAAVWQALRTG
ncbi:LCP family protein [Streptomyces aidingensis]|uniref:Cell envelope-related transcriptional attenuator domain-containing protein n=1 Tax=Streptomyces aidingensis TaxID=910347 RepID=A0A1I1IL29_9ACTN|nr:LCP family protein [Streptomyces aidingensis]SFC36927.1 Cell envelope-related transcriptional attenuator domain-containing protein [Streptomyces aidingensis]